RNLGRRGQAVLDNDLREPARSTADEAQEFLLAGNRLIAGTEVDKAQLGNVQEIAGTNRGSGGQILQGVGAPARAETQQTRFLTCLTTREEGLEATVHTTQGIAGEDRRNSSEGWHPFAQSG